MTDQTIHKQEFRIRDLSTRSVLLFPARAQIVRDIKDVTLEPGLNQIVIDGLTPTVDEHSIKVDGIGAATITDLAIDLHPNREIYEDIYPSDSEEDEDSDSNPDEDSEAEDAAVKSVADQIEDLNVQLQDEQEKINSAASRLKICENYGASITEHPPASNEFEQTVKAYNVEREKIYLDHKTSLASTEKIREQIRKLEKEKSRLGKAAVKAKEKARKEREKLRQKKLRRKEEARKEKKRIEAERYSFWPKKVYRVTISLEPSTWTPASSRRSSMDSESIVKLASPSKESPESHLSSGTVNISLTYITYSASWSPRYDLSLNTVSGNGVLEYGAELRNTTSETWKDAKVILSTSQASFQGLADSIPVLQPWHVRLVKSGRNPETALFSSHELNEKKNDWSHSRKKQAPRAELFGRVSHSTGLFGAPNQQFQQQQMLQQQAQQAQQQQMQQMQQQQVQYQHQEQPRPLFGRAAPASGGLFGSSNSMAQPGAFGGFGGSSLFGATRAMPPPPPAPVPALDPTIESEEALADELEMDSATLAHQEPALTFEEGAWEESGMTTTYDVPALKTLGPSNSTIKHKIAKINFTNIVFSHIVIAKLRPVAFLKAQLRNLSKITLLKGPLGLTLDDSFLGQATLPRCSAGDSFSLSLGVDPAVNVSYPKPTARRSQSGIFSKEDTNVFTRCVTVTNTKPNTPISLNIVDQVPISEDERLKIDILEPRGLRLGGDSVKTGSGVSKQGQSTSSASKNKNPPQNARSSVYDTVKDAVSRDTKWGVAEAAAKKNGEIVWKVQLNPGYEVKLDLQYEATFPGGETIVGV
ncbi:hypothetical protein F5884DRAFT_395889 [Xylogone sp. PMI_703]|nr:hypothetical protein F5884DRAFT_395889 [Xylogone sp. PMI_703]